MLQTEATGAQGRPLAGKVVVVTGGARGIGLEVAHALRGAGATIVLAGRDSTALTRAQRALDPSGRHALAVTCDVLDESALARLADATLETFGRIDVLVCNSGVAGPTGPLWETTPEAWREAIEINLIGTFLTCRAVLPAMVDQHDGSIVVIGSMTGKRALFGRTSYAASKLGLVGLTRTLALEAGAHGIRVNLVSPGPVEGERIERVIAAQSASRGVPAERVREELTSGSALGRLVGAPEVAQAVLFLAGDGASGVTGEDLNVSAGLVMY
jgi:NAD(P)-dependent dehydrogenase (short-subunit alcohol dehydrogenase family)